MMPASNMGVGMNMGFPDVCTTPMAPAPVPIPYPNMGMNAMAIPSAPNIFVSMMPGHNQLDKPLMTNGDNAGVAHPMCMMPGGCTMGNPFVIMNGLPSEHTLTPSYGNNFNNPIGAKLVPSIVNVLICAVPGIIDATAADPFAAELAGAEWGALAAELAGASAAIGHAGDVTALGIGVALVTDAAGEMAHRIAHVRPRLLGAKLGLRVGDELLDVRTECETIDAWDAEGRNIGQRRTMIVAGVRRDGCADVRTLAMRVDDFVPGPNVAVVRPSRGVVEIAIDVFSAEVAGETREAIAGAVADGAGRVVLDVRHSPGGLLDAAVECAGLFLPADSLVATTDAGREWRTTGEPMFAGELEIRVSEQTASAAELLAGCLRAHNRATVVGGTTFGKGSLQILAAAAGTDAVHRHTIARLILPDGTPLV